jgi:hypothetical protein
LSEALIAKVTVLTLWEISRKTTGTNLDDQIIKAVAEQLGVALPKE